MNLNSWAVINQVCTLEQAKKLAELGVKVKTYYKWVGFEDQYELYPGTYSIERSQEEFYAPTVTELGEMLGKYIVMRYASDLLFRLYNEKGLLINCIRGTQNNNEAQARAEALIWLLDQKLLTAQQINEAL